jgi:hypothetical protein
VRFSSFLSSSRLFFFVSILSGLLISFFGFFSLDFLFFFGSSDEDESLEEEDSSDDESEEDEEEDDDSDSASRFTAFFLSLSILFFRCSRKSILFAKFGKPCAKHNVLYYNLIIYVSPPNPIREKKLIAKRVFFG